MSWTRLRTDTTVVPIYMQFHLYCDIKFITCKYAVINERHAAEACITG